MHISIRPLTVGKEKS